MRLVGAIYPGDARPTFLIPYFGSTETNQLYVQELDLSYEVTKFLRFDPHGYKVFKGGLPQIELDVGDEGFMGFVDRNDQLTAGRWHEVLEKLRNYKAEEDGSDAFFAVEVMEFRKDQSGHKDAVELAAAQFLVEPIAKRWKNREISSFGRKNGVREHKKRALDDAISELESATTEQWPYVFSKVWKEFGYQTELVAKAEQWLAVNGRHRNDAERVFRPILSSKQFGHSNEATLRFLDLAMEWLEHPKAAHRWSSVWHRLLRHLPNEQARLFELAIDFLMQSPSDDWGTQRLAKKPWLDIWQKLWDSEVGLKERLFQLLSERASTFVVSPHFARTLVGLVKQEETYDWAVEQLHINLNSIGSNSTAWGVACVQLLMHEPNNKSLQLSAIDWLQTSAAMRLNVWYDVWKQLENQIDPDAHRDLAIHWLLKSDVDRTLWPTIFTSTLPLDPSEENTDLLRAKARSLPGHSVVDVL